MRSIIPAILATAATMGCNGCHTPSANIDNLAIPAGYSDFSILPSHGWLYDDTLLFAVPEASGELRVALRHSTDYPYRNIWLEVTVEGPDPSARQLRDTMEMELADPFGLWRGTGIGPTRQMEATVVPSIKVDSGSHIMVRHIMRLDTLPAIEQAGIFIID